MDLENEIYLKKDRSADTNRSHRLLEHLFQVHIERPNDQFVRNH